MITVFNGMSRAVSLTAILLGTQAVLADDLPVVNPNFEAPVGGNYVYGGAGSGAIPGWTISGIGVAGVWNVVDYGGSSIVAPPPGGGSQVGFINGQGGTTVGQTLTTDLQPDTSYTLQIDVTARSDGNNNPGTDYSVGLYAGGSLLTSVTPETPAYGTWDVLSATYTSGLDVPAGEPLSIEISTPETQLLFDNVVVDPNAVPDRGTTAMLLAGSLGGLVWFRRKV